MRDRDELEASRRSLAIGGTLTRGNIEELIEMCDRLLADRDEMRRVLDELGPAWSDARAALNRLSKLVQ